MQAWLGLTGLCGLSRSQIRSDHAKGFYSFYAFFNSAADPGMDGNVLLTQPFIKLDSEDDRQQLASLATAIKDKQTQSNRTCEDVYTDPGEHPASDAITEPIEFVWMEDSFPADGNLHQNQTRFCFSGRRSACVQR